jgi:hypothetical protein
MKALLEADAEKALTESLKNLKQDFSTSRGFFTEADEASLREMALGKLDEELAKTSSVHKTAAEVRKGWNAIVTDFHRNNYWNFEPTFAVIQSGIVLKTAVYYFGIRSSTDPSTENHIFLYLALATSAGTLIFFAWRNFHKN